VRALYAKGDASLLGAPGMAIVGSRNASPDALHFAGEIARMAARLSLVIVSGGALGVDYAAQDAALRVGYARLVCVLGSSLAPISPAVSARLSERILAAGGLVLSEHAEGTRVQKHFFSERNRLIAALADVVVVAGAREASGALITAQWAKRLGRPIWAVPGAPWDGRMRGCNQLLATGDARPLLGLANFEAALRKRFDREGAAPKAYDAIEQLLASDALDADALCDALRVAPDKLPTVLFEHVRSGRIVRGPDGRYRLVD
jgi:DNA processing protein